MKIPKTNKRLSKPVEQHRQSKMSVSTKDIDDRPAGQTMTKKSDRGKFSVNDWPGNTGNKYGDR
ncbi:MAG: hypothetical protein C0399_05725 [Syntrophus sp. (in: bacteria)]|nr:hypothetical protein [Syntrophus sp. (in: bacteria)]